MKIHKNIKAMPWPEQWTGNPLQQFRVLVEFPDPEDERLLCATILWNRAKDARGRSGTDFRIICSGNTREVTILEKGSNRQRKANFRNRIYHQCWNSPGTCYPEISKEGEAALSRWLDIKESDNHFMPELSLWVDETREEQKRREREKRGELDDGDYLLCPNELPDGLEQFIRRTVLPQDKTLIYKKGNVRGVCYQCGCHVRAGAERFRQNQIVKCPSCGEKVGCYLEGGASYKSEMVQNVATIQRGTDGSTIFVRLWHLMRDPTAAFADIGKWLKEVCRWAIRGNKVAKWTCEEKSGWYQGNFRCPCAWTRRTDVTEIYDGTYSFFLPENHREIFAGTSLTYCDLSGYIDSKREHISLNPIRFLLDWGRYPAIEKLWKAGYTTLVQERINGRGRGDKTINWRADQIRKSIKFPMRLLKIYDECYWTTEHVDRVASLWRLVEAGTIRENELLELEASGVRIENIRAALGHASVHKICKYLQGKESYTYRDYLQQCETLEMDLDAPDVLFPKNLNAAHDRLTEIIRHKSSEIKQIGFNRARKKLWKMSWKHDGLLIRPAVSQEELICEGRTLHHCVSGYANRMAAGKTAIFLIRHADKPESPFYTLEWLDGKVNQCRTTRNESYTENEVVYNFVKLWLAWMESKEKKKEVNCG